MHKAIGSSRHILPALCALPLLSAQFAFAAEPVTGASSDTIVNGNVSADELDSEFFELGVYGGILNVQDFSSELLAGVRATFHASENFFLQFNAAQAEISESTFEKNLGSVLEGSDRDYRYFDLLLGYNVLQGEVFPVANRASLSALYVVAGVGNTEFGGEESFTYTLGAGYRVNLTRRYVLSIDLRDHFYESNLLSEGDRVHNVEISAGMSFLF